jgi:hypothetical protein
MRVVEAQGLRCFLLVIARIENGNPYLRLISEWLTRNVDTLAFFSFNATSSLELCLSGKQGRSRGFPWFLCSNNMNIRNAE